MDNVRYKYSKADVSKIINKWLHSSSEDNGFLISQLYAQCVLNNI